MFAVGKIGSYISRGVYTVSGPFHPFGGAVDIVVVEQPDGTFKSSPWYVRFGKFQGVLKAAEKVVSINVDGVDAKFHMYLDHKGEAFFLREVEPDEGELETYASSGELEPYASSGDEADVKADLWRVHKSRSYNFDANRTDLVAELESGNGKITSPMKTSRRGRLFGLPFGRRSIKENGFQSGEGGPGIDRVSSMERAEMAEMAADLLEVRWTTNLKVGRPKLPPSKSDGDAITKVIAEGGLNMNGSLVTADVGVEKTDIEIPTATNPLNHMGLLPLEETYMKVHFSEVPKSGGRENMSCSAVDDPLACELGSSSMCNTHERLVQDVSLQKKVNGEVSPSIGLDDSTPEGNPDLKLSNASEAEQFSFSDLDDQQIEKDEISSPGRKGCLSQDSSESSEDEITNNPSPKENLSQFSSPISISKLHKDIAVESMPNMLFDGDRPDGISSYGDPLLLGHSLDSNLEAIKLVNDVLVASECNAAQQQAERVKLENDASQILEDIKKMISDPAVEVSFCKHLLSEGMGYEAAALAFDAEKMDTDKFSSLGPEIVENDKLVVRIGGLYFPWDAALPIASAIGSQEIEKMLEPTGMIPVGEVDNKTSEGGTQEMKYGSGSWWPFLFKRSNSMQGKRVESEPSSEVSPVKVDNKDTGRPKSSKRKIKSQAPTSEQLASLNLKDGKNEVTFTFSTAMLGKQQVEARIFLWKWNTRIVISDVDGTITKSDVLGQFMPLMGMDWSQMGVTHLFSAIKENGYQLLFLSARSISQASTTRQFLCNLKQDGKELPEGPVIISPDGLFPSLYREVIRRAPHEFKISCLEDIKVLFPPDHKPFYAGFGNRDTDEISYLRVGIPLGKIFIINPKGQIAVNRRVDTKSYTSLHALVHGMFPPAPATEQEDYNTWNFWRLPPPDFM